MAKHRRSKQAAERDARIAVLEVLYGGFYYCPTTGRIIEALAGDDKALCGCGVSNPKVPTEQTPLTGVHIVRFLRPATAAAYVAQEEARRR
jgi:hypothetical protein